MKQNTKDWIQYVSAIALIASAITLAFTSFLMIERIGEGVNTYAGIAISGGLAIFGVAAYVVKNVEDMRHQVKTEIQNMRKERADEDK